MSKIPKKGPERGAPTLCARHTTWGPPFWAPFWESGTWDLSVIVKDFVIIMYCNGQIFIQSVTSTKNYPKWLISELRMVILSAKMEEKFQVWGAAVCTMGGRQRGEGELCYVLCSRLRIHTLGIVTLRNKF